MEREGERTLPNYQNRKSSAETTGKGCDMMGDNIEKRIKRGGGVTRREKVKKRIGGVWEMN